MLRERENSRIPFVKQLLPLECELGPSMCQGLSEGSCPGSGVKVILSYYFSYFR